MMNTERYLNRLRRLRILQVLSRTFPSPMGEISLLSALQVDPELKPTLERVRRSVQYLEQLQFVTVIRTPHSDWLAACLTGNGGAFLEGDLTPDWDDEFDIFLPAEKPQENIAHSGRVSSVTKLPTEIKAWLDNELVKRSFTGYSSLAQLLAEQGYEISRSALGRYGKKFKQEQEQLKQSIEMAKAFAEVVGDDGAAMNQTLIALAQQEAMEILREKKYSEKIDFTKLMGGISALNRSDINTRKFQIEQAARQQALDDAADAVQQSAKQNGMNDKDAAFIRNAVLGLK